MGARQGGNCVTHELAGGVLAGLASLCTLVSSLASCCHVACLVASPTNQSHITNHCINFEPCCAGISYHKGDFHNDHHFIARKSMDSCYYNLSDHTSLYIILILIPFGTGTHVHIYSTCYLSILYHFRNSRGN